MTTIIVSLILAAILITLIFKVLKIKPISSFLENNDKTISNIKNILAILASFSIVFSVTSYIINDFNVKKIENENQKIYIENAGIEIEGNLEYISWFKTNEREYSETRSSPLAEFKYSLLEKIIPFYDKKPVRSMMIAMFAEMDTANKLVNQIANYPFQDTKESRDLKAEHVKKLMDIMEKIRTKLDTLKQEFDTESNKQ